MSSNRITTAVLIIGGALVFSVTGYAVGTTAASSGTECYEQLVQDWQQQANDQLEIHKRDIDLDIERMKYPELSYAHDQTYKQWQDDLQVVLAHKLDLDSRTCTK